MTKLWLSLAAVALLALSARADSVLSVTIPTTTLEGGNTAALSFDWDTTNQTISDVNLVLGNGPYSSVSPFLIASVQPFFVSGDLWLLDIYSTQGNLFQLDTNNYGGPPLPPLAGTYEVPLDLQCMNNSGCRLSYGNIEFGSGTATLTDLPSKGVPEPSTWALLLVALGMLCALRRVSQARHDI